MTFLGKSRTKASIQVARQAAANNYIVKRYALTIVPRPTS